MLVSVFLRQSSGMSLGCVAVLARPGHPVSGPQCPVPLHSLYPDRASRGPTTSCRQSGPCASPACSPHTWANIWPRRRLAGSATWSPRGCTRGTGPTGSPGTLMRVRERGRARRCGRGAGAGGAADRWPAGWSSPSQRAAAGSGCPTASAWTSLRCRRKRGWGACSSPPWSWHCRSRWGWAGSTAGHRRTGPLRRGLDKRTPDTPREGCQLSRTLSCRRPAHGGSYLPGCVFPAWDVWSPRCYRSASPSSCALRRLLQRRVGQQVLPTPAENDLSAVVDSGNICVWREQCDESHEQSYIIITTFVSVSDTGTAHRCPQRFALSRPASPGARSPSGMRCNGGEVRSSRTGK